ncbi:hypothetical protein SAMN06264348_102511 [Oceanospirillum linum]|nr:hypothetical protein SAMN04489856_10329 [Oleiphilus messinensis]SMP13680.1 hypothetical protein SAMN06264348_102511 [Oceanospirillum linum]
MNKPYIPTLMKNENVLGPALGGKQAEGSRTAGRGTQPGKQLRCRFEQPETGKAGAGR